MFFPIVIAVLVCYLLGNLNGAVSISNIFCHKDIREQGSGNAGLTNFLRVFGAGSAFLVAMIDIIKAVLACFAGSLLLEPYGYGREGMMLGAVCVCLGHDFPALLGFRGGKGALSTLAAVAVIDWRCAVIGFAVFALTVLISKYVSLGSILAALTLAIYMVVVYRTQPLLMAGGILLAVMIIFMHRANIKRLASGKENKLSVKKEKKSE